jgi:tRNA(adenine34) deaminase
MTANGEKDRYFMQMALLEAKKAFDANEVPVGAVLVFQDRILTKAHNQVELLQDATAHAEMLCLSAASGILENWRLLEATLYCTLEPCLMCAGAMLATRIQRLVWAAPDLRLGANGSLFDVFAIKHPLHTLEITKNILCEESQKLLQDFFQKQRKIKASKPVVL